MAQVFDGITVLDFTRGMPGGIATMVMSDFGAEVIKVEPPGGEKFRGSPGSIQWNRGKKSVILDLKTQDSRDHARELDDDLNDNPNLAIFRQTDNGVLIRMALFAMILDVVEQVDKEARDVGWYTGSRY